MKQPQGLIEVLLDVTARLQKQTVMTPQWILRHMTSPKLKMFSSV
jgi:hypothetical protein